MLGPIKYHGRWVYQRESKSGHEGEWLDADYYTDQVGNEYSSLDHVLLCAVAKALQLSR